MAESAPVHFTQFYKTPCETVFFPLWAKVTLINNGSYEDRKYHYLKNMPKEVITGRVTQIYIGDLAFLKIDRGEDNEDQEIYINPAAVIAISPMTEKEKLDYCIGL